jgi:hypothetical protein
MVSWILLHFFFVGNALPKKKIGAIVVDAVHKFQDEET